MLGQKRVFRETDEDVRVGARLQSRLERAVFCAEPEGEHDESSDRSWLAGQHPESD